MSTRGARAHNLKRVGKFVTFALTVSYLLLTDGYDIGAFGIVSLEGLDLVERFSSIRLYYYYTR
jgi:hypothetical protein